MPGGINSKWFYEGLKSPDPNIRQQTKLKAIILVVASLSLILLTFFSLLKSR